MINQLQRRKSCAHFSFNSIHWQNYCQWLDLLGNSARNFGMKQQFRAAGIWPFKLTPQECNNRICSNIFQIVLLLCEQEVAMILETSIFGINKLICLSTIFRLTSSYHPFKCSDLDFDVSTWSRKKPDNSFAEKQLSVVFVLDCYLQCFCLSRFPHPY